MCQLQCWPPKKIDIGKRSNFFVRTREKKFGFSPEPKKFPGSWTKIKTHHTITPFFLLNYYLLLLRFVPWYLKWNGTYFLKFAQVFCYYYVYIILLVFLVLCKSSLWLYHYTNNLPKKITFPHNPILLRNIFYFSCIEKMNVLYRSFFTFFQFFILWLKTFFSYPWFIYCCL